MGLWNKLFGTADSIRKSMRETYAKHFRNAKMNPPGGGDTPHQVGLFQALGTRYVLTGKPASEVVLYAELMPFYAMDEQEAILMLTEYIVHQERPHDAHLDRLRAALGATVSSLLRGEALGGVRALADSSGMDRSAIRGALAMGYLNGVHWCKLLNSETLNSLAREAQQIAAKMGHA